MQLQQQQQQQSRQQQQQQQQQQQHAEAKSSTSYVVVSFARTCHSSRVVLSPESPPEILFRSLLLLLGYSLLLLMLLMLLLRCDVATGLAMLLLPSPVSVFQLDCPLGCQVSRFSRPQTACQPQHLANKKHTFCLTHGCCRHYVQSADFPAEGGHDNHHLNSPHFA